MIWKPHVTVATVLEQDGRFLMVEEMVDDRQMLNQPAGHLEPGEGLVDAAIRETLEETGWHFTPTFSIGTYLWRNEASDATFLRIAFGGECTLREPEPQLDDGIIDCVWLTRDEVAERRMQWRSPLVLKCIDDYLADRRFPLAQFQHLPTSLAQG